MDSSDQQLVQDGINLTAGILSAVNPALSFTGPVGSLFFNLFCPAANPEESYAKALSEQIAAEEQAILSALSTLAQAIQGLQTSLVDLGDDISKLGIQLNLNAYNESRNVISQYFDDMVTFMSTATGSTGDEQTTALQNLYNLLTGSYNDVAIALQNIHDTVVDQEDGIQGLISNQADVVSMSVVQWIQNRDNYSAPDWSGRCVGNQIEASYNSEDIFTLAFPIAASAAVEQYVVPVLQAILTVYAHGMTFLINAWGQSDLASQLQTHLSNYDDIVQSLLSLEETITSPTWLETVVQAGLTAAPLLAPSPTISGMIGQSEGDGVILQGYLWWNHDHLLLPSDGKLWFGQTYKCASLSVPSKWADSNLDGLFFITWSTVTVPTSASVMPNPLSASLASLIAAAQASQPTQTGASLYADLPGRVAINSPA